MRLLYTPLQWMKYRVPDPEMITSESLDCKHDSRYFRLLPRLTQKSTINVMTAAGIATTDVGGCRRDGSCRREGARRSEDNQRVKL